MLKVEEDQVGCSGVSVPLGAFIQETCSDNHRPTRGLPKQIRAVPVPMIGQGEEHEDARKTCCAGAAPDQRL